MEAIKKIIRYLTSLGLAIVLLIFIAAYSIIGTVLPQNLVGDFYIENYPKMANLIELLQFDQVYSSWIFRILLGLLIINLIGCTLKILPAQIKRLRKNYFRSPKTNTENLYTETIDIQEFKDLLKSRGFHIQETESGFNTVKHKIGNIGSSVTHLGIIIIILGSFLGNIFVEEGFFNMLPGEIKEFPEYDFSIQLEDFRLGFREDKTVDQYYSNLKVLKGDKEHTKETLWVNNPLKVEDINFYQTSYGWASKLSIKDAEGEELDQKLLINGDSVLYQPEDLTVYLHGFYPDFILDRSGEPTTVSEKKINPFYGVILYHFNEPVGSYIVEPGEVIKYNDLNIYFEESILYTGITYRKDFGYFFVVLGSFILVLGLILSFYFYPKYIIVEKNSIKTATRQNSWGFDYGIKKLIDKSTKGDENNDEFS